MNRSSLSPVASALVPFRLDWRHTLSELPRLHRQMYLIYGGYVVLGIMALGLTSLLLYSELASGSALACAFSIYAAMLLPGFIGRVAEVLTVERVERIG